MRKKWGDCVGRVGGEQGLRVLECILVEGIYLEGWGRD